MKTAFGNIFGPWEVPEPENTQIRVLAYFMCFLKKPNTLEYAQVLVLTWANLIPSPPYYPPPPLPLYLKRQRGLGRISARVDYLRVRRAASGGCTGYYYR